MFTREGTSIRYVNPLDDLGSRLLTVEKPARYTGGEYGRLARAKPRLHETDTSETAEVGLKTLIAFPDLYEIGMSNQALRILYNRLNNMEGVSCDRAFAPAPDFEALLLERGLPLYGLDTGISLKDVDLLMFTLGYELGITGVFSMLDISGIPLRSRERGDDDPVVIMGGPCVSNPLPYSAFIDAFWIGEAEGGFFDLAAELAEIKKAGGTRRALLEKISRHPSVWTRGKGRAVRAVDAHFAGGKSVPAVFPVPSMKVVHHHGAVEIMRGCPNGCRFCHAGYWYRPMRQKNADIVEAEAEAFITAGGYREITLSSLSSGDYRYLDSLIDTLNNKFQKRQISFQLPSLKVSSFSLKLLDKISHVRKSGLTFAVETPLDFWQMAINKQVSGEDIDSILREAKQHGWRGAKFYFMIGLPVHGAEGGTSCEEKEIAAFIEGAAKQRKMHFNINVGTFVPKAHTPFQWAAQMSRELAGEKLNYLRARLKPQGHKVGVQDPLVSVIEGVASRGDERAGNIFLEAFRAGCRLDAWSDYFKREIWIDLLQKHKELVDEILRAKEPEETLPWSCIEPGITENYFQGENEKSRTGETTSGCIKKCTNPCGICKNSLEVVQNIIQNRAEQQENVENIPQNDAMQEIFPDIHLSTITGSKKDPATFRIIFSFAKQGSAIFHPHLGLLEIFSMAFIRAGIPIGYSKGFNPLPKLEVASPLSLGVRARGEIAAIDTEGYFAAEEFKKAFNAFLPEGFAVAEAMNVYIPAGSKKHSVSSLLWGYVYAGQDGSPETVAAKEEKSYRASRMAPNGSLLDLERLSFLAKKNNPLETGGESYFKVYRELYPGDK